VVSGLKKKIQKIIGISMVFSRYFAYVGLTFISVWSRSGGFVLELGELHLPNINTNVSVHPMVHQKSTH
jgi:hypothetical protein